MPIYILVGLNFFKFLQKVYRQFFIIDSFDIFSYYSQLCIIQKDSRIQGVYSKQQYLGRQTKDVNIGTTKQMEQCHLCHFQYCENNRELKYFLPKCCMKRCTKKYCLACIRQKFDSNFQEPMYKADTWICYSCQQLCSCTICKGIGNDKKNAKKKATTNNSKSQTKQEQKQLQDYYSQQQINSSTPFMKRILQRRNLCFKMMAQHEYTEKSLKITKQKGQQNTQQVSKEEQKGCKSIKQLIKKTLKNYGEEQDDIVLIQ